MAQSTQRAVSDGTLVSLDLSINYIDRSEITVYFDSALTTAWAWVGETAKQITFSHAVPNGVEVLVKRTTGISKLRHEFSRGAAFTAEVLDEDLTQVLHIAQEASESNLSGQFYSDIDMHNYRIRNIGIAVDDTDALTLGQYKADALGANAAKTAAKASQAAAAASATAAENSQTTAAASATRASNSASAAATSATNAATSSTNAATSATSAANSATDAAGSATSAANSAAAAATSLDDFDDRYLGSKATNPTTDNDGNALLTGALYFNGVAGEMRVWDGTLWKATGSSVGGTINTAKYTATEGQTSFAIVYDVGFVHVYLNGVKLESGVKFTANNGTSVVLATGAKAGDVVDMIAFGIFSVANTYTKAELNASTGATLIGVQQSGTGAILTTVQDYLRESYRPIAYGAVGNNVADDTAALTNCFAAAPAYSVIDLGNKTYRITSSIPRPAIGVTVRNGRIRLDNTASNVFYALVANDYCIFDGIYFLGANVTGTAGTPKYQGGILGGNTGYAAPMNTAPANYVTVRGCTFDSLTVGVWSGGANADAVPTGWRVEGNAFINIVGYPGQSEGYGALLTPSNNCTIRGNIFKTIRRHSIYLAGEASNNVIDSNIIDGCDNIAIQSNTYATQNYADGNAITNNTINGLTRSIAYGYRSSIGIGLYGKFKNYLVANNRIFGALDTGIDSSGELSGSAYAEHLTVIGNKIQMGSASTDAGIRLDGVLSGKISGNDIVLLASNYGMIVTSNASTSTSVIDISENTIDTTNTGAIAFRLALSAARVLSIFRNKLNGFNIRSYMTGVISDTSTAGTIRTDMNQNVGYYGADADFTHVPFGPKVNTDCAVIRHAATLTAERTVILDKSVTPLIGARFTIMRVGSGGFALKINDGTSGGTIKALGVNQWGSFAFNGCGWELTSFGSL